MKTCALTLSMFLCHATMVQGATAGDGTPSWTSLVNLHCVGWTNTGPCLCIRCKAVCTILPHFVLRYR